MAALALVSPWYASFGYKTRINERRRLGTDLGNVIPGVLGTQRDLDHLCDCQSVLFHDIPRRANHMAWIRTSHSIGKIQTSPPISQSIRKGPGNDCLTYPCGNGKQC